MTRWCGKFSDEKCSSFQETSMRFLRKGGGYLNLKADG